MTLELRALLKKHLDALEADLPNVRSLTRHEESMLYSDKIRYRYMQCLEELEKAFLLTEPKKKETTNS